MILDFVESCGFICCFVERDFFLGECMFDVVVDVIYWYFNLIFFVFFFNIYKIFCYRYYGLYCIICVIYKKLGIGGFFGIFLLGVGMGREVLCIYFSGFVNSL